MARHLVHKLTAFGLAGLVGFVTLTACSKASTPAVVARSSGPASVGVSASPVAPGSGVQSGVPGSGAPAGSAGPSGVAPISTAPTPPSPPTPASFNGTCDDLLPVGLVDNALGRPVVGKTSFIVGVAEPNIGRLSYLNCKYGIPAAVKGKPAPVALVEIGVSLYNSPAQAARRLQGTIEDYRSHAAVPTAAAVGAVPATVLTGYGDPTIVLATGAETIAISVKKAVFVTAQAPALTALAQAVVTATSTATTTAPAGVDSTGPSAAAS